MQDRLDLGRFIVFASSFGPVMDLAGGLSWNELPTPAMVIFCSDSESNAAGHACQWLERLDEHEDATKTALIIRDRDKRQNVAIIRWILTRQRVPGFERCSIVVETWVDGSIDAARETHPYWLVDR